MIETPWASRRDREPKTPTTRQPKADPVTPAVRAICHTRDKGVCVLCGTNANHLHHRQLRRHGIHTPRNLITLCAHCHTRVHGHVAWSREFGLIVASTDDPGEVPVSTATGRWLLSDDGRAVSAEASA